MIERQRRALTIGNQPVAQYGITIAKCICNSFLHILFNGIEGGKSKIALMIDDLCQQLSANKIESLNGLHQCVRHIEFGRMNIPIRMCERSEGDQGVRSRL